MAEFFCYTTVFNAAELFSLCRTKRELSAVEDVLYAMKVLGLNGKSAKNIATLLSRARALDMRDLDALVAGVCAESRLPLLTAEPQRYKGLGALKVMTPDDFQNSRKKGT